MIDTHCHLNDQKAFPNPAESVREAVQAGVEKLIVVGINREWSDLAVELADTHPEVYAAVGWHPTSSAEYSSAELDHIRDLAHHEKVVAIGEIGFDFYWDSATLEQQTRCLNDHLELAREVNLPIIFHCREAYPQLLDYLETRDPQPYLFHCFAGNKEEAERAIAIGAIFGVDGPITYKKADELREVIRFIGIDRLVLETDAPWLSPVPYRGKPNHPMFLKHICEGVAQCLEISAEEVIKKTTGNARRFFNLS